MKPQIVKILNFFFIIRAFFLCAKYIPRNSKNKNLPLFLRIITYIRIQKPIPHFHDKKKIMISKNYNFMIRERKLIIVDQPNKLIVHIFFFYHDINRYINNREKFVKKLYSNNLSAPKYAFISNSNKLLLLVEEKISGESLVECKKIILQNFLEIFFKKFISYSYILNKNVKERLLYLELKNSIQRLKKTLEPNSPFFKLYTLSDKPLEDVNGFWPSAPSHGQSLPINVLYNSFNKKFFFIDYEPDNMGDAPFAYDYCFFILSASDLISNKYKQKIKYLFLDTYDNNRLAKAFLAQLLWWSKKRVLNKQQIKKINERSKIALSYYFKKK